MSTLTHDDRLVFRRFLTQKYLIFYYRWGRHSMGWAHDRQSEKLLGFVTSRESTLGSELIHRLGLDMTERYLHALGVDAGIMTRVGIPKQSKLAAANGQPG